MLENGNHEDLGKILRIILKCISNIQTAKLKWIELTEDWWW